MAGGGSLGGGSNQKRGGSGKRKPKKRVGFHVDMTPLVDITFLLLTFFMFTTTMASPQVMEMSIPPEVKKTVEVKESDLFSIYVTPEDKVYWNHGGGEPEETKIEKVKNLAVKQHMDAENPNSIITAVKASPKASYGLIIDILDELNLAETTISKEVAQMTDDQGNPMKRQRRFTIAEITEQELEKINPEGEGE